ncbi:hypothetical protein GCM10018980_58540 [Streptomyces capoamus]|uniref:Uncharacterized protein n=1 Tax=Streptomyces capoamus TaxID=68183 RepID=A0A919F143_9ACTN|nr:hypothetical protein GCM10010501_48240 [Streptomyces libani subsp. rufus]GHG66266.1 hypothetical protein GCM10018980_58540 [Streptomyces capoamus]
MPLPTADSGYDYATYAPPGSKCAECGHAIGRDQVVRRTTAERASGPPANVSYRHFDGECGPVARGEV